MATHLERLRKAFESRATSRTRARRRRGVELNVWDGDGFRLEDRTLLATTYPLATSTWTALGPAPIVSGQLPGGGPATGRIAGLAADPTNAATLYAAAAGGGVWKSTDAGVNWVPLTDAQQTLSMGAIAVAPSNGQVLYAGTGEADNSADSNYGVGILKSTNGGATWTLQTGGGAFNGLTTSKIAVDPTNPNIAYAAMGNVGNNKAFISGTGVYKTTDGGATWTNTTAAFGTGDSYSDVLVDPNTPTTLYMAKGAFYGNSNNGVYKSTNAGASWSLVYNAGNGVNLGRISVAIAPTNSSVLYASIAGNTGGTGAGLYQVVTSANGGSTWANVSPTNYMGGQGWYDQWIAVSPTSASTVFVGGSAGSGSIRESTNSGATWSSIDTGSNGNGPHADQHAAVFDANGKLVEGNDGGVWRLDNATVGSILWTNLNGTAATGALNTIQFIGVSQNPFNPDVALGGSQDNGTERFTDSVGWTLTDGGDGGKVLYSKQTAGLVYHVAPIGSFGTSAYFRKSTNDGVNWSSATSGITGLAGTNFYPEIAIDPSNGNRVFIGGSSIAVTTNAAGSWANYATPGSAGFNPSGLTVDAIAVAPSNGNVVYASAGGFFSGSSSVFVTTNNGTSWTAINLPAGSGRVNEIDVDPTNSSTAYAVVSTFSAAGHVFRTTNGGTTWTNISGNLPNLPTWSFKADPNTGKFYAGNDDGVYVSADSGATWSRIGANLPHVQVYTLDIEPQLHILAAGTHGRGAWELLTQATTVTNVTSTAADGNYTTGQAIPITVAFNGVVTVSGTPKLALNSGGTASYTSGSGTSTLTFTYTVGAGDSTPHLDYASASALTLNGGKILDVSNSPATLTLPTPGSAGSLGANKSLSINQNAAPTVTAVSSTATDGTYGAGSVIPITVGFSSVVFVNGGTPTLALSDGATATYTSGSGSNTLVFTYTVAAGQTTSGNPLDVLSSSALALNGATIRDASNNDASLTLPVSPAANSLGKTKTIVIDAVAATVTNVTSTTADGTYGAGSVISVSVTFSKPVTTASASLALNSGGTATYSTGSGTNTLVFTYTVAAGQSANPLDAASASALTGTITDTVANNPNPAVLTVPVSPAANSLGKTKTIVVDAVAATVTNVTSTTADGTYGVGAVISVSVTFSKPVTTASASLALNSGGTATYSTGSGTNTLVFTYTVAAGQSANPLDAASASALTGTITDTVANNPNPAVLTVPVSPAANSLGKNKTIVIDTVAPQVVSYEVAYGAASNKFYNVAGSARFDVPWQINAVRVTFTKPIASATSASLAGLGVTGLTGLGTATLTFTVTPLVLGVFNTALAGTGADAVKDAAGNPLGGGAGFAQSFRVLVGDFNADGVVNSTDMLGVYYATAAAYNPFADVNGDGVVNSTDVNLVRSKIGTHL